MLKYKIFIALVAIILVGCDKSVGPPHVRYDTDVDGCTIKYIENPKGYNFFIAKCPGASTTTTFAAPNGKTTVPVATIAVEEEAIERLDQEITQRKARVDALNKLSDDEKRALGLTR